MQNSPSVECCVLCGANESELLQRGLRHAPDSEVRRCKGCSLVFAWPHPMSQELTTYYSQEYRAEYDDASADEQFRLDLDEARQRVRRLLPFIKRNTSLLDIGSGSGAFLDAVRPYVGSVMGVEPDVGYRNATNSRLNIRVVSEIDDLKHGPFDVVTLFHVLEHVENPVTFLYEIRGVMKPQSQLFIEVPNVDDMLVSVYRIPSYLRFYYQKAHLYYFSKETLARTLEKAAYTATIEGIQRYDLSNHIRWMLTGQPGGQGYYNDILLPSVHAAYADALIRAGHSDTLWAIAQLRR